MRWLLVAAFAMWVACDKQPTGTQRTLTKTVHRLDHNHYLGGAVEQGNLTVWPVFADTPVEIGEFLTLAEAQKRGVATVREQKDAEVATLTIKNTGSLPILVCAGSLVQGGRQDRQIGQDFVIKGMSTVPVDAFCVEHGRWGGDVAFFPVGMATAEVRVAAQYDKDQGKVWKNVAEDRDNGADARGISPIEQDASSVCEVELDPEVSKRVTGKIRAYFKAQATAPVGFAYAIGGKPVSVRTFAHPRLFAGQFNAFLDAMCLEALLSGAKPARGKAEDIVKLVRAIGKQDEEVVATKAANSNGYRKGKAGFSGSCYVLRDGRSIAITRDWSNHK